MYITCRDEDVLEMIKMNYPLRDIFVKIAQERYKTLRFFHPNSLEPVIHLCGKFQKKGDDFVTESLYKECRDIYVHGQKARFSLADGKWYTYGHRVSEKEAYIEHIIYRTMMNTDNY